LFLQGPRFAGYPEGHSGKLPIVILQPDMVIMNDYPEHAVARDDFLDSGLVFIPRNFEVCFVFGTKGALWHPANSMIVRIEGQPEI
jgi:hypothetical protein